MSSISSLENIHDLNGWDTTPNLMPRSLQAAEISAMFSMKASALPAVCRLTYSRGYLKTRVC